MIATSPLVERFLWVASLASDQAEKWPEGTDEREFWRGRETAWADAARVADGDRWEHIAEVSTPYLLDLALSLPALEKNL